MTSLVNYDHLTESGVFAADTRPHRDDPTSGDSPKVWRASHHMEIDPLAMFLGLVVIVPICIFLNLWVFALTGLVTP